MSTVSYTHLDVYKRQVLCGDKKKYALACQLEEFRGSEPGTSLLLLGPHAVSYTHLVPGAALGGAQIVDKGYEVPEVIALFANKIYHTITPSASSFRLKNS